MRELSEAAKAEKRAYKRKWARENRDKVRAQQRRYWEKRAAQAMQASQKAEEENNGEE